MESITYPSLVTINDVHVVLITGNIASRACHEIYKRIFNFRERERNKGATILFSYGLYTIIQYNLLLIAKHLYDTITVTDILYVYQPLYTISIT